MHCPRCGQQQISEQTKFCSRCGFQLGLVSELLANGGFLPQLAELYKGKTSLFTRKNGVIFTLLWFVFWVMVTTFFGVADIDEGAGVAILFGIFSSIMLMILSLAVLRRAPKAYELTANQQMPHMQPQHLYGNQPAGALPPQQTQPATSYMPPEGSWRVPDTGDLVRPGSVTEGTTKLLQKEE